jgi:hypothetical protein
MLALEAQQVIGLRLMKLTLGGNAATRETNRMVGGRYKVHHRWDNTNRFSKAIGRKFARAVWAQKYVTRHSESSANLLVDNGSNFAYFPSRSPHRRVGSCVPSPRGLGRPLAPLTRA